MMPLQGIVTDWLRKNGYDGLVHQAAECGCTIDDLMLCGEPSMECQAGYKGPSPESGVDFWIYPSREAVEAAKKRQEPT